MSYFKREAKVVIAGSLIEDLRIYFRVEKSLVGYPNLALIRVYNLSPSEQAKIEKDGLDISLFAGYEGNAPLLFKGEVTNIHHRYVAPDWITEIYAGDSIKAYNDSVINTNMAPGSTPSQIFDTLVSQMKGITKGISKGVDDCLSKNRSLLRSLQLTGNVKDWLTKLANDCFFDYSINEGIIETTPANKPFLDAPPHVVNQNSGMIGSPERSDIGVTVKVLLSPELKLGRRFRIEAITTDLNVGNLYFRKIPPIRNQGIYRMDKLISIGDLRDNIWETAINGRVF
jgi:hypothetical protein